MRFGHLSAYDLFSLMTSYTCNHLCFETSVSLILPRGKIGRYWSSAALNFNVKCVRVCQGVGEALIIPGQWRTGLTHQRPVPGCWMVLQAPVWPAFWQCLCSPGMLALDSLTTPFMIQALSHTVSLPTPGDQEKETRICHFGRLCPKYHWIGFFSF